MAGSDVLGGLVAYELDKFEKQTGINVHVVDAPYDDAHQKMLLSFQAKKGAYDVVQFDNPFLAPFASQNALTDLGPYTAKSTPYDISDFVQPLQDYNKYNGTAVDALTDVSLTDISDGKLVFTPDPNGAGASYSTFTLTSP